MFYNSYHFIVLLPKNRNCCSFKIMSFTNRSRVE